MQEIQSNTLKLQKLAFVALCCSGCVVYVLCGFINVC